MRMWEVWFRNFRSLYCQIQLLWIKSSTQLTFTLSWLTTLLLSTWLYYCLRKIKVVNIVIVHSRNFLKYPCFLQWKTSNDNTQWIFEPLTVYTNPEVIISWFLIITKPHSMTFLELQYLTNYPHLILLSLLRSY